jgi:carbamoyl-phosphate synthase small subunit
VTDAVLVLEDGSVFRGRAFGAKGEAFGEAVFNTAMSGYQEVLTDPSYAGQIVTMTSPHQGNYGVNDEDRESRGVKVAGFVVREASRRASSWRSRTTLTDYLCEAGVIGVEGVDTRRLTRRIREGGAMRAGISTVDLNPESLCSRVRTQPGMEGADLASTVSISSVVSATDVIGPPNKARPVVRIAAYDFGIKWSILRQLAENSCETTIFPAHTPASDILEGEFDGVFLSNGPGDPSVTTYGVEAVRALLGKLPIFAICLGHQLLALALGGRTYKLRFGHRGVNQPVIDVDTGRIEITSHNHGFAVDPLGWGPGRTTDDGPEMVEGPFGRVALTHWNLNDGTLEGLRCIDVPAFSVQYHPEASPGPHDSIHLFQRFLDLMT